MFPFLLSQGLALFQGCASRRTEDGDADEWSVGAHAPDTTLDVPLVEGLS